MHLRFQTFVTRRVGASAAILCTSLLVASCSLLVPGSIGFSAPELEAKLAERLPLRRTFHGLFDVELDRPKIGLDATEGRISAGFDLGLRSALSARVLTGSVRFSGTPRYDVATQSIMLERARIEQLDLVGVPQGMRDRLIELAALVARDVIEQRPLYTLKPEQLRWAGMPLAPRGIRIANDRLLIDLARVDLDAK
jgi:Protein of unknown function (DUF1439)